MSTVLCLDGGWNDKESRHRDYKEASDGSLGLAAGGECQGVESRRQRRRRKFWAEIEKRRGGVGRAAAAGTQGGVEALRKVGALQLWARDHVGIRCLLLHAGEDIVGVVVDGRALAKLRVEDEVGGSGHECVVGLELRLRLDRRLLLLLQHLRLWCLLLGLGLSLSLLGLLVLLVLDLLLLLLQFARLLLLYRGGRLDVCGAEVGVCATVLLHIVLACKGLVALRANGILLASVLLCVTRGMTGGGEELVAVVLLRDGAGVVVLPRPLDGRHVVGGVGDGSLDDGEVGGGDGVGSIG